MARFTTLRTFLFALLFFIVVVFLVFTEQATQVAAARPVAAAHAKGVADRKQPEFFFDRAGNFPGVYIPGLGRVAGGVTNPRYIPGLDDTFVPNPGYEVPNPYRPGRTRPDAAATAAAP